MRSSLFYALQGALGVAAYESLAYNKNPSVERGDCHSLPDCRIAGKDHYVPDPSTFFFPHAGYNYGNTWDLCKGDAQCSPHDAYGKVHFDFKDESLVFDFEHIDDCSVEDIIIHIQRDEPPNTHSPKYDSHNGYCKPSHDRGSASCHIPYHALTNGGSFKEMCPIDDKGSWIFYIQIKVIIRVHGETIELYSRGVEKDLCWWSLSYCCTKCPDCKHECPHGDCHKPHPPKVECAGEFLAIYGTSDVGTTHPFSELAQTNNAACHSDSCYNRYHQEELEVTVAGTLGTDGKPFGSFFIGIEKEGKQTEIVVSVTIDDARYFATEIAVFFECEGGISDGSVCEPQRYPYSHSDEKGMDSFTFTIVEDFKCKGDYIFAVWVLVCVAEGDCHYCKSQ